MPHLVLAPYDKVILVSGQVKVCGKVPTGLPPLEVPKDKLELAESISNTSEFQQIQQTVGHSEVGSTCHAAALCIVTANAGCHKYKSKCSCEEHVHAARIMWY
jgi:hypothetical protein